jgi:hypothetical protein
MDEIQAQTIADRALAEAWIGRETARLGLPPALVAVDPGDVVDLIVDGRPRSFRLTRITDSGPRAIEAQRTESAIYAVPLPGIAPPTFVPPTVYGRAILEIMDLPVLRDSDIPYAPYVATTSSPFAGVTVMDSPTGDDFAVDTALPIKGTIGETILDFYAGPTDYFDVVNTLRVKLYAGELASASEETILSGRSNALALLNADGDWEIVQFCNADLVATRHARATRGRCARGSPRRRRRPAPSHARGTRAGAVLQMGPDTARPLRSRLAAGDLHRPRRWPDAVVARSPRLRPQRFR